MNMAATMLPSTINIPISQPLLTVSTCVTPQPPPMNKAIAPSTHRKSRTMRMRRHLAIEADQIEFSFKAFEQR